MTKCFLLLLAGILESGCVSFVPYSYRNYLIGQIDSCNVGSSVVFVRDGWKLHEQAETDSTQDAFVGYERELLYTGTSGSTVHLVYREYQTSREGVMIRAPYTLPVQYDITMSHTISFRSFLIQVLRADPNYIVYTVLQDQNQHGSPFPTSLDSLHQRSRIVKEVPKYLPSSQRQFVKVITISGAEFEAYLAGESDFRYFFSASATDTSYSATSKKNIKSIVPAK